jgi:hypothetical protein
MYLDAIQDAIQDEKAAGNDLEAKLREWEHKTRQKQAQIGGANMATTFKANVQKHERIVENQLDTVETIDERNRRKIFT